MRNARQSGSPGPYVGKSPGNGSSNESFLCSNPESVLLTGGGTDFIPNLYPDNPVPNQSDIFPFPIETGIIISASGDVSAAAQPHDPLSFSLVFNNGVTDSAPISFGMYHGIISAGIDWRFDIEIFPTSTYDPENTIFTYRCHGMFTILSNGVITDYRKINESTGIVFTLGEEWFPKLGFAVGGFSVGARAYRRMIRYQRR